MREPSNQNSMGSWHASGCRIAIQISNIPSVYPKIKICSKVTIHKEPLPTMCYLFELGPMGLGSSFTYVYVYIYIYGGPPKKKNISFWVQTSRSLQRHLDQVDKLIHLFLGWKASNKDHQRKIRSAIAAQLPPGWLSRFGLRLRLPSELQIAQPWMM